MLRTPLELERCRHWRTLFRLVPDEGGRSQSGSEGACECSEKLGDVCAAGVTCCSDP